MPKGDSKDKAYIFQLDGDVIIPNKVERQAGALTFPEYKWILEQKDPTILYEMRRADGNPQARGRAYVFVDQPIPNNDRDTGHELRRQPQVVDHVDHCADLGGCALPVMAELRGGAGSIQARKTTPVSNAESAGPANARRLSGPDSG